MASTYYIGSETELTVEFFDMDGSTPADPTVATIKVRDPAGVETSHVYGVDVNVVKESVGVYHLDQVLDQAGTWFYRGIGTGAVVAAGEKFLRVQPTSFTSP